MAGTQLVISGADVQLRTGRKRLASLPLGDFVRRVAAAMPRGGDVLLPAGVRLIAQRARGVVGVVVELPAQARRVRWIRDDSEREFGPGTRYQERFLSFPYVVLVLVLCRGQITGFQELYYRREPLQSVDDALLLPNLPNVAEGYQQRCWLCLQHLRRVRGRSFGETVSAIAEHVFAAAFNRSAEAHEGNSWWQRMRDVDPRVATLEAWEEATREDRFFALGVPWRPAGVSVAGALENLLAHVESPLPPDPTAEHLAGIVLAARAHAEKGSPA